MERSWPRTTPGLHRSKPRSWPAAGRAAPKVGTVLDRYADTPSEAIKKVASSSISVGPSSPYVSACLEAYRANFDPVKVETDLVELDAKHTNLYRRYADLPTKLAREKAGAELADLEAEIERLKQQRENVAEVAHAPLSGDRRPAVQNLQSQDGHAHRD